MEQQEELLENKQTTNQQDIQTNENTIQYNQTENKAATLKKTENWFSRCSKGSILQYFQPSLSYHLSLRSLFYLFLSVHLTQVLQDNWL